MSFLLQYRSYSYSTCICLQNEWLVLGWGSSSAPPMLLGNSLSKDIGMPFASEAISAAENTWSNMEPLSSQLGILLLLRSALPMRVMQTPAEAVPFGPLSWQGHHQCNLWQGSPWVLCSLINSTQFRAGFNCWIIWTNTPVNSWPFQIMIQSKYFASKK